MTRTVLPRLGAEVVGAGTHFGVFARPARRCAVRVMCGTGPERVHELSPEGEGYFGGEVDGVGAGARYVFDVDGRTLTDPFARCLPDGVHAPARVVKSSYAWEHAAPAGRPLTEHVLYELHVGTFTPEGTFRGASAALPYLAELGVTALELMPLSSFQGARGWGYDGVAHFAPHASYGEPDDLRHFIDQAHGLGLSVLLDVVFNHFGPAGNYLGAYAPEFFQTQHATAWGEAPNFGGAAMRRYAIDNALYWFSEFRIDGLRFDATHAIFDSSPRHVLGEIADRVRAIWPHALLIAEDERNEPACLTEFGVQAIWADDFHHQLHVTLTGERDGYYAGYVPSVADLARTIERGWLYEGQLCPPTGKPRGKEAGALGCEAFVYCIQNHDQVGNRAFGTRLNRDVALESYCMASTLLLFLPMTPLLFMGQEWAASTPFLYFTDHDVELGNLVTAGRRQEFSSFAAFSEPALRETIPDPQATSTFEQSRLRWEERERAPHARVLALYRGLLALRRSDPVLCLACTRTELTAESRGQVLCVRRRGRDGERDRILLANFGSASVLLGDLGGLPPSPKVLFASQPGAPSDALPAQGALLLA